MVALLTVTVVGTLLAGPLVDLYAGNLGTCSNEALDLGHVHLAVSLRTPECPPAE